MTFPRDSERTNVSGPLDATDPQSFAAHFGEAYPRLAMVAAGMLNDRAAAEDIVQDAAVIAYQRAGDFAPGSNFTAWLAEIVRRCALNYRRKQKMRKTYPADPAELARLNGVAMPIAETSPIAASSGELLDDQAAFDDELLAALQQLSAEARCCLLLRTVEKLSYAEIAGVMSMPEGTAMSHVHRSRTALRRILSGKTTASAKTGARPS